MHPIWTKPSKLSAWCSQRTTVGNSSVTTNKIQPSRPTIAVHQPSILRMSFLS